MAQAAKDDSEREMQRARLYAPPQSAARPTARRPAAGGMPVGASGGRAGMSAAQAQALVGQAARQDAELPQGRRRRT